MDLLASHLEFLEWNKVRASLSDHAESSPGRAAVRALTPCFDRARVALQLARTGEALALIERDAAPCLERIGDLRRYFEQSAEQSRGLTARELWLAALTLQLASEAAAGYRGSAPRLAEALSRSAEEVEQDDALAEEILATITSAWIVVDEASELLTRIRNDLRSALAGLQAALGQLVYDSSVMLAVLEQRPVVHQDMLCLKVDPREIRRVPGPILGDEPGCLFVEPDALREHYNRVRHLRLDEQREARRILGELSERTQARRERYERLADGLVTCDVHQALARYGRALELVLPELVDSPLELELRGARHPLLAEQGSCVPIDLRLDPSTRLLVITGPNGGGKTVAMKTVGLSAALAQCGCYVPAAAGARLPVFERFLTVAESKSSVSAGVSTFQAHARDLAAVAEASAPGSLILLDEVGVGTDPGEATALARAFLEHMLTRGSLVLATTHLSPLKTFAQGADGAAVAAVGLDADGLPTFRLAIGEMGRSYALEVARRAGLPAAICDRAAELHRGQA